MKRRHVGNSFFHKLFFLPLIPVQFHFAQASRGFLADILAIREAAQKLVRIANKMLQNIRREQRQLFSFRGLKLPTRLH